MLCTDLSIWKLHLQRESRLEKSHSLITLRLPAAEVVWMHPKEVAIKGRMFDIRHKEEKDGLLILTGHYDEPENKLLKKQQETQENNSSSALVKVLKSLQLVYYNSADTIHLFPDERYIQQYPALCRYKAPELPVSLQPPRSGFFS